jgi:hypothetical protein
LFALQEFPHGPDLSLASIHRQIEEEPARLDIAAFDLLPFFSEIGGRPEEYSLGEWHSNANGGPVITGSPFTRISQPTTASLKAGFRKCTDHRSRLILESR